jgi:hypothetical protein
MSGTILPRAEVVTESPSSAGENTEAIGVFGKFQALSCMVVKVEKQSVNYKSNGKPKCGCQYAL